MVPKSAEADNLYEMSTLTTDANVWAPVEEKDSASLSIACLFKRLPQNPEAASERKKYWKINVSSITSFFYMFHKSFNVFKHMRYMCRHTCPWGWRGP